MIVAPALLCLRQAQKKAESNTFAPISDPFEDIPSCFRTGLDVWQGACSLLLCPNSVVKQETTPCILSWVGGMASISPGSVCSPALGSWEKYPVSGVGLDSSSDSRVPTHGATSIPSMPAFSGNPN